MANCFGLMKNGGRGAWLLKQTARAGRFILEKKQQGAEKTYEADYQNKKQSAEENQGGKHLEPDFENQDFAALTRLYIRFHQFAEADKKSLQEARDCFQKLETGSAELKKRWEYFVQLSLKNYDLYWKALNISHDLVQGESFYARQAPQLRSLLKAKKLLEESEGAEVVFFRQR